MRILSIGEILWDVFDEGEHLGGAPFNFAAHAAQLGHEVYFLSAVGEDERGRRALARVRELGLTDRYISRLPGAPTGTVTVELSSDGQPSFTIHRPAAYDLVDLSGEQLDCLAAARPDWICFGTLHQMHPGARRLTRRVLAAIPSARRFYDVNLRPDSYTPELVRELLDTASVVKLNDGEVTALGELLGLPVASLETFCLANAERFGWQAVCVTRGADGCSLLLDDEYIEAPGLTVDVADTVGAGDAFSAAFLHGLGAGWPPAEIAAFANRVGAFVAGRPGAIPAWTPADL